MGSSQSILSTESAITAAVVAGFIGVGYAQIRASPNVSAGSSLSPDAEGKKGKKKRSGKKSGTPEASATLPTKPQVTVVQFPTIIPGQFEPAPATTAAPEDISTKSKKPKKKKAKPPVTDSPAPTHDHSSSQPKPKGKKEQTTSSPQRLEQSTLSVDTDGSWTRVNSRHRSDQATGDKPTTPSADLTGTSDTGITTSLTGNSSPIAERTEDEGSMYYSRESVGNQKTLAEKLLPKPRKTKVADMLETPDYPTLARVIHVRPHADDAQTPASGFSWGDYENAGSGGAENDADGEDDGWGVVKSKNRSKSERSPSTSQHLPASNQPLTKKQRQNASKREAQKATKAASESERLALLTKHKRELERAKIMEQYSNKSSSKSGGMSATVDDGGKLVWE